jgi:uncharacterized protein (TIGR02265 family)
MTAFEKVAFKGMFEALFRALGTDLSPELQGTFRQLGVDVSKDLHAAYAMKDLKAVVDATVAHLYGTKPTSDQIRQLGRRWANGYFDTLLGSALAAVLRLIGPRRAMLRSPKNYSSINNYSDASVRELGPSHFELFICETAEWPALTEGSLQRSVEVAGGKHVTTAFKRTEGQHQVYDVTWVTE